MTLDWDCCKITNIEDEYILWGHVICNVTWQEESLNIPQKYAKWTCMIYFGGIGIDSSMLHKIVVDTISIEFREENRLEHFREICGKVVGVLLCYRKF